MASFWKPALVHLSPDGLGGFPSVFLAALKGHHLLLLTLVGAGKSLSCFVPQLPFSLLNVLSWLNLPFLEERNVVLADFLYHAFIRACFMLSPTFWLISPLIWSFEGGLTSATRPQTEHPLGSWQHRQASGTVFLLLQHRHHDELSSAKAHGL